MAKTSDKSRISAPDPDLHGPLSPQRIPHGDYTKDFLSRLQLRNEVIPVPETWSHETSTLPSGVHWVIYPNGDLERIDFD